MDGCILEMSRLLVVAKVDLKKASLIRQREILTLDFLLVNFK